MISDKTKEDLDRMSYADLEQYLQRRHEENIAWMADLAQLEEQVDE